jgi:hypothetical protein
MSQRVKDILADRQQIHGDAKTNFAAIGRMWGAILKIEDISPTIVALMYDAGKTIRCVSNPLHEDNWLDKIGYTQHGMEISNDA